MNKLSEEPLINNLQYIINEIDKADKNNLNLALTSFHITTIKESLKMAKELVKEKRISPENPLGILEEHVIKVNASTPKYISRYPHRCPLCEGRGKLPPDGTTSNYSMVTCHGCSGKGIVWG